MHYQIANEELDFKREQAEGGHVFQVNRGNGEFLNHRYEIFLHCLIRGGSIKHAAAACNISYRTAIRWMRTPAIQELYEEIADGLAEYERDRTQKAATLAMDVLVQVLQREEDVAGANDASTNVAIKAAKVILEHASREEELKLLRTQVRELQRIHTIDQAHLPPISESRTIDAEKQVS